MKRWLPLVLFLVLVGFFAKGLFLNPREVPSPFIGRTAPAFTLPVVGNAGAPFSPADMKGKIWMLNIWAPWCVSCRQEHGFLMQLAQSGRPETYIIDRQGIVRLKHVGPIGPDVWQTKFEPTLKELGA
ncbi:MAG: redoxin domain-containing protein [Thiobacillus sp.]|nr:redoxin domain-containing protein [Thiobacillus sp.]